MKHTMFVLGITRAVLAITMAVAVTIAAQDLITKFCTTYIFVQ